MPFKLNPFTGKLDYYESGTARSGTVTDVSVVSANGLAGSVATSTTTPAITLTTTVNAPALAGNGTAIAAATTTGSGSTVVLNNTPTLVTPILGTPTSGTLTNCTGLPSIVVANEATDTTCFPLFTTAATGELAPKTNANLAFNSNTGVLTLTAPVLGTPTSGNLSNCTALPISTGVSGLGSNVATFLATPSSANLASALTDETGTGLAVFNNSPTFVDDITVGTAGTATGSILMKGTTSGTVTVKTADAAGTWTLTLPTTDGDANQFLQTNGSGGTTWATPSGSGSNSTILTASGAGSSATRFFGIGQSGLENATETNIHTFTMPFAATLQNLYATIRTAPGAGTSWTITVRTDESVTDTMADTTLTCSIADANVKASDTTHQPTVSAGKRVTIAMTRVSTASAPGNVTFSFEAVHS